MQVPISISMREDRPAEVSVREWSRIGRESHTVLGEHWHRHMLPLHFAPDARDRYGYAQRSRGYLAKKANMHRRGQAAPPHLYLVFRGDLRRAVTSFATIRGFPTRATLQLVAPPWVTPRPRRSQPDLHNEIVRVTREEAEELSALLAREATRRLDRLRAPRTTMQEK